MATEEIFQERGDRRYPSRHFILMGAVALVFVGISVIGVVAMHLNASAEVQAEANPPITVATARVVHEKHYELTEEFVGRVEPVRQTTLGFERSGLVVDVRFDEGDRVIAGEVVAVQDTAKLEVEKRSLQAQRREVQARRDLARATLKRQKELRTEGWQTEQRYDEARYSVIELTAAIERLNAMIASIDVDIEKSELIAPFDGVVAERAIDEGTVVGTGQAVLGLLENHTKQVRIGVSIDAADQLTQGRAYVLNVSGSEYLAELISIRPDVQTGTRTIAVIFELNGKNEIPFGAVARLPISRDVEASGLWLPISALTQGHKGTWTVFAVESESDEQRVFRAAVEILHVAGQRVYVRGTLRDGDKVITEGSNRVVPGQLAQAVSEGG